MNIGIIKRKYLEAGGGGAEKYARYIVEELINRGHKIFIFTKNFVGKENKDLKYIPVDVKSFGSSSGTMAFHKAIQKVLYGAKSKYQLDLLYALSRTFPVDVFRATEQIHADWMKRNYPVYQRLNPRHLGILFLEKNIFNPKNTKAIVTNSKLTKRQISKNYNFPEDRINVIQNGTDTTKFYPPKNTEEKLTLRKKLFPEIAEDKFILLFIANNFKIKGLESAIKAVAMLEKRLLDKTILVVLGEDCPIHYQKLAKKLNIENKILFLGTQNNLKEFYVASDLLLYPSLGEPFGNVCLEACACGLPVLTTEVNGSSEVIIQNKNGFVVKDPSCINEMANIVNYFFGLSNDERNDFSTFAAKSVLESEYNWQHHVDKLEKLFLQIKQ